MRAWLVFAIGGLGTYLLRASFIVLGAKVALPPLIERSLRAVGPAVFAAIVAPPLVGSASLADVPSQRLAEVVAAVVAGFVAWRTGRVAWVLAVGMVTLWVLHAIGL